METGPDSSPSRGARLDSAPPQPGTPKKVPPRSLMDTQGSAGNQPGQDLGAEAGNPQVLLISALGDVKQKFDLISAILPGIAPALAAFLTQLQQAIPQAMADQLAGVAGAGAAAGGGPAGPPGAPGPPPPGPPPGPPPPQAAGGM